MAGTLLHVTLAEQAALEAGLAPPFAEALVRCRPDFHLGSVLPDLPYFERLALTGLRLMFRLDVHYSAWGTLLHRRSPAAFALALLDRAKDAPGRALALGYLTHLAVDLVFHAEIEKLVLAAADGSRGLDTLHKHFEDQFELHAHCDILGHSGLGTAYARQSLCLLPHSSSVERFLGAIHEVHAVSLPRRRALGWLGGLCAYGALSSVGWAPWVNKLAPDDPALAERALAVTREAVFQAAALINVGVSYLNRAFDREGFLARVEDRSMLDGQAALPVRLPA